MPRDLLEIQQPRDLLQEPSAKADSALALPPSVAANVARARARPDVSPITRQLWLSALGLGKGAIGGTAGAVNDALASLTNIALGAARGQLHGWALNAPQVYPTTAETLQAGIETAGLPTPKTGIEKGVDVASQMSGGAIAGNAANTLLLARLGLPLTPPQPPIRPPSQNPGADILLESGVPLDASQRSGSVFAGRVRSALGDNPMTAARQAGFAETQRRAFTKAVLRRIGEDSDQATQRVMNNARSRIGNVFQRVADKHPAMFDDALQNQIAETVQLASRELPANELKVLSNNVDDILNAVDNDGRIYGPAFKRIGSTLGNLSRRKDIGHFARDLQEALYASLERSDPSSAGLLQQARQQWRNLRIIEGTIGRGMDKYVSPSKLANAIATKSNRPMSVFGLGGDQTLVKLAEAGRQILPETLPQSGTIPRGLMQAPLRAIATWPAYHAIQTHMWAPPNLAPSGQSWLTPSIPQAGANAVMEYPWPTSSSQ